ncbi:RNA polymerase sigma factor [uncultured Clostridium sp.]|uniref:RNA polymerase sigma factor n=1 Tax=uncultured Clostridium sp. TaxID=59620 RepID=UPI0026060FC4|nr:RNA polymerase sigma factor [uncultured Clostridium sp.]
MEAMGGRAAFKEIKKDKEKAFNCIVEEFSERIYNLARLYTKDYVLSEDITQEVLVKIYRYLDNFKGESSIYTWIYRITINTCKNIVKKEEKYKKIENVDFIKEEGYEEEIVERLDKENLINALENIKNEYKTVIYLYYYEELKISEISEILDKREGTVKTWLKRGKTALEKELLKDGRK